MDQNKTSHLGFVGPQWFGDFTHLTYLKYLCLWRTVYIISKFQYFVFVWLVLFHVNTPYNASNYNEIKYRTTPFIVCIYPSCIPFFVCIVRKKKVSKSINISIFCPEKKLYLQHWKWLYVNILYLWTTIYLDNIPIVLHLGILFMIRL